MKRPQESRAQPMMLVSQSVPRNFPGKDLSECKPFRMEKKMKKASAFFMVVGLVAIGMYVVPVTAQAQTAINATEGTPTLDGIVSPGEWTSNSVTTTRGVTIQSMIDDNNFYVLATWPDTTQSVVKDQWTFDGTTWSKTGNDDEDRVMFIWDMGLSGADIDGGCFAFCHIAEGNMFTNNPGDRVDVWHWKATRFNPMGFSDDKYWDDVTRRSDTGAGSGDSNSGPPPAFMATSDPGAGVTFLTDNQTARNAFDPFGVQPGSVDVKGSFDAGATFTSGDVIPGRILTIPSGNRASVQAAGKWFNGTWTVEFARSLGGEVGPDGNAQDFTVVRGSSVKFSNEIFDNVTDHAGHAFAAGGSGPADMVQAYTINFPAEMTVLVANFMNGNNAVLNSRVYLYNGSNQAGNVTVRVFTLPISGGLRQELTTTPVDLGSLGAKEAFNIKLDVDILTPAGITTPYTDDGGNVMLEITVTAPNVTGAGQVFSGDLAFGTYPLQVIP